MRSFILNRFFIILLSFYTIFLASCGGEAGTPPPGGGGGGLPPPNVVVSISPSPATLNVNGSLTFIATVTLNGTTTGVDQRLYWWLSTTTGSSLGTTYTYTAPGSPATATLTGQSVLNVTDSAVVTINVVSKGVFTSTEPLTTPRIAHTATLLQDGTVLIVGGYNNPGSPIFLSSAELYNYTTSQFSAITSSVVYGRAFHSATLLQGGNVLVAGGTGAIGANGALNSAYTYQPAISQFATSGYLISPRSNHTATLLPNGYVLLAGGTTGGSAALPSAEIYNLSSFLSSSNNMSSARMNHTATLLKDGTVLVTGGNNGSVSLKSAEIFNSGTGLFTTTSNTMTTERAGHTSTLLNDGTVLITGGINAAGYIVSTAEIYSPGAKAFALTTGSMTTTRMGHQATLLSDGSVLITGGTGQLINGNPAFVTSSAEVYSPATGTFLPTGTPMNNARVNHTATLLPTGEVLISGGFDGTEALSSAEIYTP